MQPWVTNVGLHIPKLHSPEPHSPELYSPEPPCPLLDYKLPDHEQPDSELLDFELLENICSDPKPDRYTSDTPDLRNSPDVLDFYKLELDLLDPKISDRPSPNLAVSDVSDPARLKELRALGLDDDHSQGRILQTIPIKSKPFTRSPMVNKLDTRRVLPTIEVSELCSLPRCGNLRIRYKDQDDPNSTSTETCYTCYKAGMKLSEKENREKNKTKN